MDLYDHNKLEEKKKIKLLKSDFIEYDDDATVMVVLAPKAECFKDQKWFKEVASIPISNSVEQRDANGSVLVSDPPYMFLVSHLAVQTN